MAQRLLDEQQSNQTGEVSSGDFSTLAWKFNNLNSTAKMLLVGASPSSVPFIPISELADSNNSSVTTYNAPPPNSNLSISSLSNPSIATKQPNFYAGSKPSNLDKNTKLTYKQSPIKQEPAVQETPFNTGSYNDAKEASEKTFASPVAAKEKTNVSRNIPFNKETAEYKEKEIASTSQPEQYKLPTETTEPGPVNEPINNQQHASNIDQGVSQSVSPSWSYKGLPVEEEEEYYSLKEELSKKQNKAGVGPFLRGTVKSAAIVSLIALLGFGTYNLLKKSPEQDIENYINDQDDIDEDFNSDPFSDRVEQVDGSGLSNKSFYEQDNDLYSSSESSSTEQSNVDNSSNTYYQPTVRSKPKTIKPAKPKVYSSPAKTTNNQSLSPSVSSNPYTQTNNYSSSSNPYTSTSSRSYNSAPPTAFLYDPSTIYDSSSNEAISPSTYTPERFPIEISYAKSSSLYEAPISPYNNPTPSQASSFNASSFTPSATTSPEVINSAQSQGAQSQESVQSGYPAFKTSPYSSQSNKAQEQFVQQSIEEKQNTSVSNDSLDNPPTRLESVPVVQTPSSNNLTNTLTPEEESISDTSYSSATENNQATPTYPQYKTPAIPEKTSYTSSTTSQPIYSKPVSQLDKELDIQSNQDDVDLSVPILRQPVQSSSNNVQDLDLSKPLPTPYNGNVPLTSSSYVSQDTNKVQLSTPEASRGKVNRFLDRFKSTSPKTERAYIPSRAAKKQAQRAYQNQIASIEKRAQSPDLTDFERQKLIAEIEDLKGKIISTNSAQRSIELNRKINNLEKDANSVYIEPSPYDSNGSNDSTLNIS